MNVNYKLPKTNILTIDQLNDALHGFISNESILMNLLCAQEDFTYLVDGTQEVKRFFLDLLNIS